jgi:hypothetical protein
MARKRLAAKLPKSYEDLGWFSLRSPKIRLASA